MLTASQVQGYVYTKLRGSSLKSLISGDVYRAGYRPRDSRLEDAVVVFTAGQYNQIEEGIVTINIFVPDIDPYQNGVLVENGARTAALEEAAAAWVESLTVDTTGGYRFTLRDTITTAEDTEMHQHFVVVRLYYNYFV